MGLLNFFLFLSPTILSSGMHWSYVDVGASYAFSRHSKMFMKATVLGLPDHQS